MTRTRNKLTRPKYAVLMDVDGTETEHIVAVTHGDQIRGEATARTRRLPSLNDAPYEHASIWVWHAMTRQGLTDLRYPEWTDAVLDVERLNDEQPVDPTEASTD